MMYDEKLAGNCVAYARVSTDSEGQAESCKNQMLLCDEYAKNHPELNIVGKYIDDGISGATNRRPQFNAMIERVMQGGIQYIIAKDESRLCRSTEVDGYLQTVCRECGVKIIFIVSNNVFDPFNGEQVTMHGFHALINQHVVFGQSQKGITAHKQKCKAKRLNATDVRYGYYWDYENKCMAVNEEEAAVVRKMFEWYVYSNLGVLEIARKLAELGVYGARSGKMLTANTVLSRLADESYKGLFHINKKGSDLSVGMNAKKKRFSRPKEEWVAVDGPAIVSEELFDMAQKLREERRHIYDKPDKKETQARFKGTHLFSGKVFCGECGTQFHFQYADRKKTIGAYKDYFSKKKKEPDAVCNNKRYNRIYERTLIGVCGIAINTFLRNHETCIDNLVNIIREASIAASKDDEPLTACKKRLAKIEKELKKNLIAWRDAPDPSMKDMFLEMYQQNKNQKDEIEREIENFSKQQKNAADLEEEILGIKEHIEKMKKVDVIDRSVVDNFIERIIVCGDGRIIVILKFGTVYENLVTPKVIIPFSTDRACLNLKFYRGSQDDYINWQKTICGLSVRCSDRSRRLFKYRTWKQPAGYAFKAGDDGFYGDGASGFGGPKTDCIRN